MISFGNFARVQLVGRLFRDPEVRTFANGGKVAKLSFVMSYRKKNNQTGEWDDEPMFIDIDVFNRGENGRDADHCSERLSKGSPIFVEGQLKLEQWEDSSGQKRSKHKILADTIVFIDPKPSDGDGGGGASRSSGATSSARSQSSRSDYDGPPDNEYHAPSGGGGSEEEIPF